MLEPETKSFNKGETIFEEGDASDVAYIIVSGSVELTKRGRMKIDLAEIIKEGFFGLLPVLDRKPRNYTAKAREKTTCLVVPRALFMQALEQSNPIIQSALHSLSRSVRQSSERLSSGGIYDSERGDTV